MTLMIIANILGVFVLTFLLWLKLKEDYHYEKIFNLSFFVIFGLFVSSLISKYFAVNFWFWINLAGIILGFTFSLLKQKMKFYETFNALVIAVLPYLGIYFLFEAVKQYSLFNFIGFWIVLLFVFIYFFLESIYRKLNWYKSGRVGFSGLVTAGLFFLVRSTISYFFPSAPSLVGSLDLYISTSFSFLFFLLLFNLSRKVV